MATRLKVIDIVFPAVVGAHCKVATITADIFLGYVVASNRERRIFGWRATSNAELSPAKHVPQHDGAVKICLLRPSHFFARHALRWGPPTDRAPRSGICGSRFGF